MGSLGAAGAWGSTETLGARSPRSGSASWLAFGHARLMQPSGVVLGAGFLFVWMVVLGDEGDTPGAEILLFHHAQGQTPGFLAFVDELRAAGYTVHAPDLYDGKTFGTLDEGVAYAKRVGFDTLLERGRRAAESLPDDLVYAGFSLGAIPAQMLPQTRPGARGPCCSAPLSRPPNWAPGRRAVPLQIH
jgi:hypothetical protein